MIKFHIFLESGTSLTLTPTQEKSIEAVLFGSPEPKVQVASIVTKQEAPHKKRKTTKFRHWTAEEDAAYEKFLFDLGRVPNYRDFKVLAKSLGRTVPSVTGRYFIKYKQKIPTPPLNQYRTTYL